jgi:superoxide dismutase, Cu-Zn family
VKGVLHKTDTAAQSYNQSGKQDMSIQKCLNALGVGSLVCLAVLGTQAVGQHAETDTSSVTKAVAVLFPTKGSDVKGHVTFTHDGNGIHVHAEVTGLTPGEHGFHIHEFGVWSENGMDSGGHFNPSKAPHASPHSTKRHVGDLGNITANANGNASYDLDDATLSFRGPHSIIGRGLVVHEKVDDLKSQPTGNAGARLAVGVIGIAKR